ncbi:MAG TPA: DUF1934 domain-containing protein [Bacilli bacterium]
MPDKETVQIRLSGVANGDRSELSAIGELYRKAGSLFLHYTEEDNQNGRVTSIIKISPDGVLRIKRHGAIETDLTHIAGQKTRGTVRTGAAVLYLDIFTEAMDNQLLAGFGTFAWTYALQANDQHIGAFHLALNIAPLTLPHND